MVNLIGNHDKIDYILVDQYTGLQSNSFKEYLKKRGIELRCTPVDHASKNGIVERVNQTLINNLRCKINENKEKRSWTTIIKEVIEKYNDTMHGVTKFTPNFFMFGTV